MRANFGRFSLDICNEDNNRTLNTNCIAKLTHRILNKSCDSKQNCTIQASEALFGVNSCPGVPKYLEISYKCVTRGSKRTYSSYNQHNNLSVNTTSQLSKHGRLNQPSNVNNKLNTNNDNQVIRNNNPDTANHNEKTNGISNNLNELNKKSSQFHLENNQNPFLYGGQRVSNIDSHVNSNNNNFNIINSSNNQSSINQVTLNSPNVYNDFKDPATKSVLDSRQLNLTNYCPRIKIKGAQFDPTPIGEPAFVSCPAGASNQVSWQCRYSEDGQRAAWSPKDKPDFSKCSSLWLNSLEENLKEQHPMITKLADKLAIVTNQDSLGNEFQKQFNSMIDNDRHQQYLYARDLYRISEICVALVNKLENFMDLILENKIKVTTPESPVYEILVKLQDTISNLLVESNRDSWLELQPSERTLAISSLMSSLKKNALLYTSTRPIKFPNFDRISRHICKYFFFFYAFLGLSTDQILNKIFSFHF